MDDVVLLMSTTSASMLGVLVGLEALYMIPKRNVYCISFLILVFAVQKVRCPELEP